MRGARFVLSVAIVALTVLVLAAGVAASDIYATAEGRSIKFKDTEYGFNYDKGSSIWRKPITAAQAEAIKRANVAYLEVPRDFQEVNRTAAHGLAATGAMRPHTPDSHPRAKVYSYKLQRRSLAPSERGKMVVIHRILLVISPASAKLRALTQHEHIELLTEPRVEIVPKRTSAQNWDVYLVITKHGTLAGPGWGGPDRKKWHKWWKARGVNDNYQDGWFVRLKYAR